MPDCNSQLLAKTATRKRTAFVILLPVLILKTRSPKRCSLRVSRALHVLLVR